jgi:hypothetical protein
MRRNRSLTTRVARSLTAVGLFVALAVPAARPALARADCRTVAAGHGLVCGPYAWCQDGNGYWHNAGEQVTVPNGRGGTNTFECGFDGYWYRV